LFDFTNYVPIVRWKKGEWLALRRLHNDVREKIIPLIEITPSTFILRKGETRVDNDARLRETSAMIAKSLGKRPFFLDGHYIDHDIFGGSNDVHSLKRLVEYAEPHKLDMILVTGLRRRHRYQNAIRDYLAKPYRGLCLRLNRDDLNLHDFQQELWNVMDFFGLQPSDVDILIDQGDVRSIKTPPLEILKKVPALSSWRTLTITGGAFPVDLTELEKGVHKLPRLEWASYKRLVGELKGERLRVPTYSDYTIRHPVYKEPVRGSNPSASIRYTCHDYWVVLRGEGLRTSESKNLQYVGHSIMLQELDEYCGPDFSHGDSYVEIVAGQDLTGKSKPKPGSPMSWISAGVNHHITFAARQIANLFGS
jgi:hypothetical protein